MKIPKSILSFTLFKSKTFISLNSLGNSTRLQRYFSIEQTITENLIFSKIEKRINGILHSETNTPAISYKDYNFKDFSIRMHYRNGKLHSRRNIPSFESFYRLEWHKNGELVKTNSSNREYNCCLSPLL